MSSNHKHTSSNHNNKKKSGLQFQTAQLTVSNFVLLRPVNQNGYIMASMGNGKQPN